MLLQPLRAVRNKSLDDPMIRWPPVAVSFVVAVGVTLSYLTDGISLVGAGVAFAFVAFAFTGYLWLLVSPNPPYDILCGFAFLALGFGLAFLAAPDWLDLFGGDTTALRAVAAFAFGILPGLLWILYSSMAVRVDDSPRLVGADRK